MKKIYPAVIAILFCFTEKMRSQYCSQYFEGASNCLTVTINPDSTNIWQIGKPQKTFFDSAASLPNAIVTDTLLNYPTNNTSSFLVSLSPQFVYGNLIAFQWKQKIDLQSHADAAIVEYSTKYDTVWRNAHNNAAVHQFYGFMPGNKDTIGGKFCFSGSDTTWRDVWLCFWYNLNWQDTLKLRFTLQSDSVETNQEGWLIDNILFHPTIIHTVKEFSMDDDVLVYPNSTSGILNVEHRKNEELHPIKALDLFDIEGNVLERFGPNYAKVVLDLSRHPSGQYLIRVTTKKRTKSYKILLQK